MLQVMCRKRMSWWIFAAVKQNMRAFLFFDQSWCNNISCHIQFVHQLFQNLSKGPSIRFPGMRLLEMVNQLICGVAFAPSVGVTWCPIRPVSIQDMCQYQCSCLCLWVCLCLSVSEQQVELAFQVQAGLPCPEPGPLVLVQALPGIVISQLWTSMSASLPRWCSIWIIARSWLHPPLPLSHCAHSVWSSALFRRPISLLNDRQDLVFFFFRMPDHVSMHDMVDAASSSPARCHCLAMFARLVLFLSSHFISSSDDVLSWWYWWWWW